MDDLFRIVLLGSVISTIFLSLTVPSVIASTEGPLDRLGDMLGFETNEDSNDDTDRNDNGERNDADDTNNIEPTGGSLPIPSITQRDQPIASTSSGANASEDEFVMNAEFEPHEFLEAIWELNAFGFNVSPNSSICPSGNCEFEFEDGQLKTLLNGDWELTGRLKVGVETAEGLRSTIHDVRGEFDREETLESGDTVTDMLEGEFRLGSGLVILPDDIDSEYQITNGTLTIEDEDATLVLRGIKQ